MTDRSKPIRPDETYRGARRNRAKAMKLVWRALERIRMKTGQIVVRVP